MKIISRKDALALGLKRYFTGNPCKHGHVADRLAECGVCSKCSRISVDRYAKSNKDKIAIRMKNWRAKNMDYSNNWYDANKEKHKKYTKDWKKNNPERVALLVDRRKDCLRQATPKWYESEQHLVKTLFLKRDELSKILDIELTVDHIIPIQGDGVCGLHCWDNLQLLDRKLNGQKINKYETDW